MTWKLNKFTVGTKSMDTLDAKNFYLVEGMNFSQVEDTSNPAVKKATTDMGTVFYVPSDSLVQVS